MILGRGIHHGVPTEAVVDLLFQRGVVEEPIWEREVNDPVHPTHHTTRKSIRIAMFFVHSVGLAHPPKYRVVVRMNDGLQ